MVAPTPPNARRSEMHASEPKVKVGVEVEVEKLRRGSGDVVGKVASAVLEMNSDGALQRLKKLAEVVNRKSENQSGYIYTNAKFDTSDESKLQEKQTEIIELYWALRLQQAWRLRITVYRSPAPGHGIRTDCASDLLPYVAVSLVTTS